MTSCIRLNLVVPLYLALVSLHAQSWNQSQDCHTNARTSDSDFGGRADVIDATFRWRIKHNGGAYYECTGVLMNRSVDQDQLGYYFSTARHCLHTSNVDLGAPDIDFSAKHQFTFHYESPTDNSDDTYPSNEGRTVFHSTAIAPQPDQHGFEYLHESKVELISESITGDYALLRMVTPPPPHFNLYFAGWHPSSSGIPANGVLVDFCDAWHSYVLPNHPKGDIKKINGAASLQNITLPTYVICDVVTTLIDVLFGWLWGNEESTQVICSYVDNPWYTVEWCDHGVEEGSSGSPLFNPEGRYVGPLSGLSSACNGGVPTSIGKFKNVYPAASIKNTLNPGNDLGIDWNGIGGRRIQCYTNLDLPGGDLDHAYYFPANHYQAENRITLRAMGSINVSAPITILEGAHYEFKAGGYVELNGLVDVRQGATFLAEIQGCTKSQPTGTAALPVPEFVKLPKHLESVSEVAGVSVGSDAGDQSFLTVYQNPGADKVALRTDFDVPFDAQLISVDGRVIPLGTLLVPELDASSLAPGLYLLRLTATDGAMRMSRFIKK